jgi:spoIIIJ-associated protein
METEEQEYDLDPGEVARDFVLELLAAMELPADVELRETEDGGYRVNVVGEEAGDLVGRYGDGLNALQYLTGLVVQKRTGEHIRLTIDADGYRQRREDALVEQAKALAAEVVAAGQEAELDPLNAFERRIIHNALMDYPGVTTYSEGEGDDRRVIIAPKRA